MLPKLTGSSLAALALIATALVAQEPLPVRHGLSQPGEEFLVLRHQYLEKGRHEDFYRVSREGVWPLYEKIGARVVGQWQVVFPEGEVHEQDEGYRLARYRSFDHWLATRNPAAMAGNGGDLEAGLEAIRLRNQWRTGSKGVTYLAGPMAPGGPYFLPPLEESYRRSDDIDQSDEGAQIHPVRSERAKSGREVVALYYFKIAKSSFDEIHRLSRTSIWPFYEKMGARIVGLWRVVYPERARFGERAPGDLREESPDFDESYMLVRYASREHFEATRPRVMHRLGGDGKDYDAASEAMRLRGELILDGSVELMHGHFYSSPPIYTPSLDGHYVIEPPGR